MHKITSWEFYFFFDNINIFFCMCACMCMYVLGGSTYMCGCTCVCRCTCTWVLRRVEARGLCLLQVSTASLACSLACFSKDLELIQQFSSTGWSESQPRHSCLALFGAGVTGLCVPPDPAFYMGTEDSNSGLVLAQMPFKS